MYFPTLSIMSHYRIDDFLTTKLDVWLGTRRQATRRFLSPLQFSLDTGIDEQTSIYLFAICTDTQVGLLRQRYVIDCEVCDRLLGEYGNVSDIPSTIYCAECNRQYSVHKDMIAIWFELLEQPVQQPFSEYAKQLVEASTPVGKH